MALRDKEDAFRSYTKAKREIENLGPHEKLDGSKLLAAAEAYDEDAVQEAQSIIDEKEKRLLRAIE